MERRCEHPWRLTRWHERPCLQNQSQDKADPKIVHAGRVSTATHRADQQIHTVRLAPQPTKLLSANLLTGSRERKLKARQLLATRTASVHAPSHPLSAYRRLVALLVSR